MLMLNRGVLLDQPTQTKWQQLECPSCGLQISQVRPVMKPGETFVPMHNCTKLGLPAPLVEVFGDELVKNSVRHVRVDPQDYVGDALVRLDDNGRPAAAMRLERADGSNDCHVFAPTARYEGSLNDRG